MNLTAEQAKQIAADANNGKRRTRIERWMLHIQDMASMGKTSTKVHVFDGNKASCRMTNQELEHLVKLGYRVSENEKESYAIISWQ